MTASTEVVELLPRTLATFDVAGPDGDAALAERYGRSDAAFVRMNMITAITGDAAGVDGTSDTLTSPVDRRILAGIRAQSDVVLVGAQTVRAEGYIRPRRTALAIVTSSGDLSGSRLTFEYDAPVFIVCPADRAAAVSQAVGTVGVELVPIDGERPTPDAIVAALADRGLRRVVCEGGPTLASEFARAGVIDEFCVTVAPVIAAAEHPFLRVAGGVATAVAGMLVDAAGFSFLRLRPQR